MAAGEVRLSKAEKEVAGRPVDVLVMPDGSLLISDDRADMACRVFYRQPDE